MIGQIISHYRILEKLGEGGMGVVYKAQDTSLERTVALKFLPRYLTADQSEKERFYHEARAASALNHPNVTTIYEIQEHEQQLFLAMEFVEGKTIRVLLEAETLSIKKVLDLAIQIGDGLSAAHEKGIVHRDIKPENIMVTPKGQVKIMDFGLAKVRGATKLTQAGSTLGTAAYMSPEQAQGEEVDRRSDIFSSGVVLYEMLTGRLPFRGEHHAALMYSLINEEPPPIPRFNDKVTPEVERIVAKTLAKDREDRYQHADELVADLRRERKNLEYARTTPSIPSTAPSTIRQAEERPLKEQRRGLVFTAAGVILLVILAIVFNPFNLQIGLQQNIGSEKNSLAVMYFENIPDPEDKNHTGEMITNLLITSLFQTSGLDVISRERLYEIQKDLGQVDQKSITPSMATMVAKRAGVSMMLLGSILQESPGLSVTFRIIEVESGKILSTQRFSGFGSNRIFALVDTMAAIVKSDLDIRSASPAESRSVAEVTTKSPEAYRSYVEGVEFITKMLNADARSPLKRAVELDPEFAMAHYALAVIANRMNDAKEARLEIALAERFSSKVTERERLQILAFKYRLEGKPRKSAEMLERLVERSQHEQQAYVDLIIAQNMLGEREKALQTCRRGLERDPSSKLLWNTLAYGSAGFGNRSEALPAIDEYLKLAPGEPNPYDSKGDVYYLFRELDSARYWYTRAVAFRANFPSAVKLAYDALLSGDAEGAKRYFQQYGSSNEPSEQAFAEMEVQVTINIFHGQLAQSYQRLQGLQRAHQARDLRFNALINESILTTIAYELHNFPAMLQHAEVASQIARENPDDVIYSRDLVAWALAMNGKRDDARRLLKEIEGDIDQEFPSLLIPWYYAAGLVAFEEEKYDEAARSFRYVRQHVFPLSDPDLFTAVTFLRTGDRDEAMRQLRRLTTTYIIGNIELSLLFVIPVPAYWPISAIKAHYWLGVAQEEEGNRVEAIKEYEKFLNIWKEVDFRSAEWEDARARVARLRTTAVR
jgi:serine/threonine protein kinase/Flp pilus assembly protein TadD